jgi:hypothetical protein
MRRFIGAPGLVPVICLLLASCRCGKPEQPAAPRLPGAAVLDVSTVLATLPDGPAPPREAPAPGLGLDTTPLHAERVFSFSERGGGVAWTEESAAGFQVFHNGNPGKTYAAVGALALSPDGRSCAHGALVDGAWRMVVDGKAGAPFAAVQAPVFSPDGAHLAYQAMAGERWNLVVDGLVRDGTSRRYEGQEFSADGGRLAFITEVDDDGRGTLVVSDLAFKSPEVVKKGAFKLTVNASRTRLLAVVTQGPEERLVVADFDAPSRARLGPVGESVSFAGFGPDGLSVMQVAVRGGRRVLSLGELEFPLGTVTPVGPPSGRPGLEGAGILVATDRGVVLQEVGRGAAQGQRVYEEAEGLVYSGDGATCAYAARRGESWYVVVGGQEGPPFDRVVTPAFSADGRMVVYRARKDGARFVVVAGLDGKTVRQHRSYEQVFPVRFTADGKSVAYGVKDGRLLAWKVEPR